MKYILEIYHKEECIEQRNMEDMLFRPNAGEQIYIDFENRFYSDEYGNWWIVKKVKHLIFSNDLGINMLQLFCEPDPHEGE